MSSAKQKVVVVSLVTALCLLGDSMLYVVLPIYWTKAGLLSLWEVGLILSVNRLVRLPLNPVIGWLYTKITLRTGFIVAVIFAALTTLGYGVVQGLWLWVLLRCLWGFSWSLLRLGGFFTVIGYAEEQNRGYYMGLYNGLYRLGSLFGMLFGGLLASLLGLSYTALIFGLCSFSGLLLVFWAVEPRLITERVASAGSSRGSQSGDKLETGRQSLIGKPRVNWFQPSILKVISSGFIIALLIQGVFASTLSYLLSFHFSESVRLFGFVLGVAALSGILQGARWIWEPFLAANIGHWSDGPRGRLPYFLGALLVSSIGYACLPWGMSIYLWLFFMLITMLAATALTTLIDALTADVAKTTDTISLMTIYTIALDCGAAVGPLIAYLLLLVEFGLVYTYLLSAGLFILIALLWLPYGKLRRGKPLQSGNLVLD